MKNILILTAVTAAAAVFIPLFSLTATPQKPVAKAALAVSAKAYDAKDETFRLYRKESKTVEIISAENYICGVLAAEMPISYEPESLKAQAVAAYGFALYRKETRSAEQFDVTDDYTTDQSYIPLETAQSKWGEKAAEYTEKLKNAYNQTKGQRLTYNGKTALTVYHAISSGRTNSAEDVWGSKVPYLKSVDSSFDKSASGYLSSVKMSAAEVSAKLSGIKKASGKEGEYFSDIKKNSSGRVMKIKYCGENITGAQVSKALSLRSSSFDVKYEDGNYIFTVYGYGHGVGMSQNGANQMAKQGSSYKEILYHYYPDCKLA